MNEFLILDVRIVACLQYNGINLEGLRRNMIALKMVHFGISSRFPPSSSEFLVRRAEIHAGEMPLFWNISILAPVWGSVTNNNAFWIG
jgi:hypothetical protein